MLTVDVSVQRMVALLGAFSGLFVSACHGVGPAGPSDTGEAPAPAGAAADTAATPVPTAGEGWAFSPAARCEAPVDGFDRLRERGADLGLRTPLRTAADEASCGVIPGAVVAADLDGDGADELIFNHVDVAPLLVRVDGGALVEVRLDALAPPEGRPLLGLAAADLDGDGATDLIGLGEGFVVVAPNDGQMGFGGWEAHVWQVEYPRDCFTGIGLGDIDSDGDLDASLPGLDRVPHEGAVMGHSDIGWLGSEDRLLRNDNGVLVHDRVLPRGASGPSLSLVHLITDRDNDGDQDIFAWSDRAPLGFEPAAAWRNDGLDAEARPRLIDDALEVGLHSEASAMGLLAVDLNDDGLIDTCVSDINFQLDCRLSSPEGYYEGALLLGLFAMGDEVAEELHPSDLAATAFRDADGLPSLERWTTWGLAYVDLENDGFGDVVTVAGPPPDRGSVYHSDGAPWQPDWIWRGNSVGRFETAVRETGFHSLAWGYGLVSADLFGDGHRELIVGRADGLPEVWDNPCGAGAWIELRLEGAGANLAGVGAQVELWSGGRRQLQQVLAQTGVQQHSLALHFGLGEATQIDELTVRWPDGQSQTYGPVPVNGMLRLQHPAR